MNSPLPEYMEVLGGDILTVIPIGLVDFLALRCTCAALAALQVAVTRETISYGLLELCRISQVRSYTVIHDGWCTYTFDFVASNYLIHTIVGTKVMSAHPSHERLLKILAKFLPDYVHIIRVSKIGASRPWYECPAKHIYTHGKSHNLIELLDVVKECRKSGTDIIVESGNLYFNTGNFVYDIYTVLADAYLVV